MIAEFDSWVNGLDRNWTRNLGVISIIFKGKDQRVPEINNSGMSIFWTLNLRSLKKVSSFPNVLSLLSPENKSGVPTPDMVSTNKVKH